MSLLELNLQKHKLHVVRNTLLDPKKNCLGMKIKKHLLLSEMFNFYAKEPN